jgi:hypothetical protein
MDESAVTRAKGRMEGPETRRIEPAAVRAVLERTRDQVETLAATAAGLEASLPGRVQAAIQDGVREQAVPVGRNLAEIRGLLNHVIRRLERLEGGLAAEAHARVDDLALLVDLIGSGWSGVDARLARVEALLDRIEQELEARSDAIVYRLEDRRPEAASGS